MRGVNALNIAELRLRAKRRLPRGIFVFVDRGAEDDVSVRDNRAAIDRIKFRPRILTDISSRDQSISLFGSRLAAPLVVAPTGMAGLLWRDGEIALSRAAATAGIPFTVSTGSMTSLEQIADAAEAELWFQLYMWGDRSLSSELVERALSSGYRALIVTVDVPVPPNREYNVRNGFTIPFGLNRRNLFDIATHPKWFVDVILRRLLTSGMPEFVNLPKTLRSTIMRPATGRAAFSGSGSVRWEDFRYIRSIWKGPLLIKGVLHRADAEQAADHGADGIVVSNHGGRVLDGSIAPIEVLARIADLVGNRVEILVDSGFVRGSDIAKALALGAKAVMLGRAPLWGVAAGGEQGARCALAILSHELDRVMAYLGCNGVAELGDQILVTASEQAS